MALRQLTDVELEQIKTAKQAANNQLKELRENFKKRRRFLSDAQRKTMADQLLASPTGKPVIAGVDGQEIYLDYELLKKFTRSLDRQGFCYSLRVDGLDYDRKLTVAYQSRIITNNHGTATLLEIPPRQRDLLHGLPKVELE